jgi:hypothetical protein
MQHDNAGQMQAEGQRQGERQAEVKALRRWLRNRGDKADPLKFKRVHLSEADVLDIADQMGIEPAGEADTDQPPFTMTPKFIQDNFSLTKMTEKFLEILDGCSTFVPEKRTITLPKLKKV